MNFYQKHILPKFLDLTMKSKVFETYRKSVVETAKGTVLEIGSGSGLNFPYYGKISKLYALEPSKEMHKLGKENMNGLPFPAEYIASGAEGIPLQNNSVDTVISTWTFCTIPHPEKALSEILRVLKPYGTFSFIEHGKSPKRIVDLFQRLFTPISKLIAGGCHLDRDIESLIQESGLKIEHLEKFALKRKPIAYMYKGTVRKPAN
jgi:ubiquinone/menaquinone biosynthesis C-methylase UbiE